MSVYSYSSECDWYECVTSLNGPRAGMTPRLRTREHITMCCPSCNGEGSITRLWIAVTKAKWVTETCPDCEGSGQGESRIFEDGRLVAVEPQR
jgi:hypothetical protein